LPSGRGKGFREDMEEFVERLQSGVPQAFESEEYEKERESIWKDFQEQRQQLFEDLEEKAESDNLTLLQTQHGIMVAPIVDGEVISPEEFNELEEQEREKFEDARREIQDDLRETLREVQELQANVREKMKDLDRKVLGYAVEGLIDQLKEKYSGLPSVGEYLESVRESLMDNIQAFKQLEQYEQMQRQMPFFMQGNTRSLFDRYRVNLLVDNEGSDGAPVVHESNPTYYNLVGRIEHQGQLGSMTTDFSMIKNGALHRANGGYRMMEARDGLPIPFAWDALNRALDSKRVP
jgi:Lon-like ATP-dependent protease